MRHDPRMRIYSPEELHPSPSPAELAKMCGYSSVEEMEKACAESIPEEPICNHCGVECQDPESGKKQSCDQFVSHWDLEAAQKKKWAEEHPYACQFCSDFNKGHPSSFYDPGESEGCEGTHWQSMYLSGFPFPNGCKHHSKRRIQGETAR
jgi:hypothetical protein